jgi:poly-gamma-glutamate synthesis protein (capsule biosynthesis protein)
MEGKPVSGATVSTQEASTTTDSNGWFEIPTSRPSEWLTVEHPKFLSRTRAATSDSPVLFRLTPEDGDTISLNFAGDVMFGRRFYDPNEDGNTSDGLLQLDGGALDHLKLFRNVQPLLENADITAVNLETPLTPYPYISPTAPRPRKFHPTKEFVFASAPEAAVGLRKAGVDVVDLGNNHLYDAQEQGIDDTLTSLSGAGFKPGVGHFGGGRAEDEAWRPAVTIVKGQSVAFIGCTTVTVPTEPIKDVPKHISYVASDAENKGGAAECDESVIRAKVAEARAKYDIVVMMIHGGFEYERSPSENVRRLTNSAREAGATLVINGHPHVVGGLHWADPSLTAWTMGNLLFDQTVWPTFESYILRVELRRGQVINAYAEPLRIESFMPEGLTGELADHVAREAAGNAPGPLLLEDGAAVIDVGGRATPRAVRMPLEGELPTGTIFRLDEGSWVSSFSGAGRIRLGRDLLWVGSFEDEDVDPYNLGGALWDLHGDTRVESKSAYDGAFGARLQRDYTNSEDAILTPLHRILIEPNEDVSVVGMVRASTNADLSLQLSWYSDTKGPSSSQTIVPLNARSDNEWQPFRVDVTTPANLAAIGLYLRLKPPLDQKSITADFDNIRLIKWARPNSPFNPLFNYVSVAGPGEATISEPFLPGTERWAAIHRPKPFPLGKVATPPVARISAPQSAKRLD